MIIESGVIVCGFCSDLNNKRRCGVFSRMKIDKAEVVELPVGVTDAQTIGKASGGQGRVIEEGEENGVVSNGFFLPPALCPEVPVRLGSDDDLVGLAGVETEIELGDL